MIIFVEMEGIEIYKEYLRLLENRSSESSLVFLYMELNKILKDPIICDSFLLVVSNEILSTDAATHILNALSPIKDELKYWSLFVSRVKIINGESALKSII